MLLIPLVGAALEGADGELALLALGFVITAALINLPHRSCARQGERAEVASRGTSRRADGGAR